VRVTIVFRSGRKPLTGELRAETDTTYEIRYTDRDSKYHNALIEKSQVREVRPVLPGMLR